MRYAINTFFLLKFLGIAAGTFTIYLGYKLFDKGVFNPAGNVSANGNGASLTFDNAAPGTFFTVLGAAIILFTIYKKTSFSAKDQELPAAEGSQAGGENKAGGKASGGGGSAGGGIYKQRDVLMDKRKGDF